MVGLDTNVLVRYLAQDDTKQSPLASRFIENTLSSDNPGFVSVITLCEVVWVLSESYGADRKRIRDVLEGLLTAKQIVIERADIVWKALRAWEGVAADFSDALIGEITIASGGEITVTFDKGAAKLPGFELLQ